MNLGPFLSTGRRVASGLCFISALFTAVGCGPSVKAPDPSKQATISGKITLDGSKPAPVDSNVVFYLTEKSTIVAGKVDVLGNYSAKPAEKETGIPAGRYQVMIRPPEPPAANVNNKDEYNKMMMQGGAAAKPEPIKSDIPGKFHAFDTSKIVLEIKPGPNTIDLDLSKL
jgi:hypothetical protein